MQRMIGSAAVSVLLGGFTGAAAQLPPEITVDRYLLQAEQLMAEEDYEVALEVIDKILALQKEHNLTLPEGFHFKYAQAAFSAGAIQAALESVNQYLATAGRDGEFYREALKLLIKAENATAGGTDDDTVLDLLRAHVSAGVVLANSSQRLNDQVPAQVEPGGQFTKANLYLALDMMPDIPPSVEKHPLFQVDPLVNIRLSSVGVNTSTGDANTGFKASTFIQSQKAAEIHLGGVVGPHFSVGKPGLASRFKWSFGMIGRLIFQSITDSEKALRIWDVDDIYHAYMVGGRFSHEQVGARNVGPSLLCRRISWQV